MRVLFVAATEFEVGGLKARIKELASAGQLTAHHAELLITGVGMVATAFALGGQLASRRYDLVVNLGIAGSFDRDIPLGEVAEVTRDHFSELGAEDGAEFLTIDEMGFGQSQFNSTAKLAGFSVFPLRQVSAITVNTVHGHRPTIKKVSARLNPQLESMEGAAVLFACMKACTPCLQIRAVSNYVEKRNREAWNIGLAIKNLNSFALEFLQGVLPMT
jgi:futalosine hydrolase